MTLLVVFIFLVDQISKYLVATTFRIGESRPMIPGVFHLTYVMNTGGAFGLLKGWAPFLIVISLVAIVVIVRIAVMRQTLSPRQRISQYAVAAILGGALGNLADRLHLGYVVDFLDFRVWPVFNVADVAITIGVGLLILEIVLPPPSSRDDAV